MQVAVGPVNAVEAGRPDHEGRGELVSEQGDAQLARAPAGEHTRAQAVAREALAVGAQRALILGTTVKKIEYHLWQTLLRQQRQVVDIDRVVDIQTFPRRQSVGAHSGVLHHFAPLVEIAVNQRAELLGRTADHLETDCGKTRLHLRRLQGL